MENIKHIFGALAQRLRNENDLSDFTWAFCEASPTFKKLFISFFFKELENVTNDISLVRECAVEGSRADFFFTYEGVNYVIENKIGDRSQHFKQYDSAYDVTPNHFGYIMNYNDFDNYESDDPESYRCKKDYLREGYIIKTWTEFDDYLEAYLGDNQEKQENDEPSEYKIIRYYMEYLRIVCNIVKFKEPMNLAALTALPKLRELLDKRVLDLETENFTTEVYNNGQTTHFGGNDKEYHPDDFVFGRYFKVHFKESLKIPQSTGWYGIYFQSVDSNPLFCIMFDDQEEWNWGGAIYNLIANQPQSIQGNWYWERYHMWYNMDNDTFMKLNAAQSIDEQATILQSFLVEVLQSIVDIKNKTNQAE